jgi:hypothetical protein
MLDGVLPASALSRLPFAGWGVRPRRDTDLRQLAREVEVDQPALAEDLRGIAMHEECVGAARSNAAAEPAWRRIARGLWESLEAVGRARARREMTALAERWDASRPELAEELREATTRL